ncbi:hypothetical protein [Psychrobacillus sp. FSL K6-2843]|uniref:hypothetical protein n=1 Tax=Psychrobacillus sp. FSL K6-2843 TaxID=2921549 RepID=UPI00315A4511
MGLVIYRKSDNKVEMEVIQYPLHDTEIFEKFIANGGHKATEFGTIEITEDEIATAMQKEIIIVDGQITFGEDRNPVVPEPLIPSEADALTDYIVDVDYRVTMIELGL